MLVLGLDISSSLGWAFVDSDKGLVKYGTYAPGLSDSKDKDLVRDHANLIPEYKQILYAEIIAEFVIDLLTGQDVSLICVEQTNPSYQRSAQKGLEFLHYAVLKKLRQYGFSEKVQYLDSSAWRSILGIKLTKEQRQHNKAVKSKTERGKITWKHLSVERVNKVHGLSLILKDNDACDAINLCDAGILRNSTRITPNIDFKSVFSS